jgi:hypothetical protein
LSMRDIQGLVSRMVSNFFVWRQKVSSFFPYFVFL